MMTGSQDIPRVRGTNADCSRYARLRPRSP